MFSSSRARRRSAAGRRPRGSGGVTSRSSRSSSRSSAQPESACRSAATCSLGSTSRPPGSSWARCASAAGRSLEAAVQRQREGDLRGRELAIAERARRALGDDLAGGDHGDPVGEPLGLLHVVGRQEDRLAELAQPVDDLPRGAARGGVEAGRRLVEEDQLGVADQRERDVEAAALPARERGGALLGLRGEVDERERVATRRAARGSSRHRARGTRGRSGPARPRTPAGRCRSARASSTARARGRGRAPRRCRRSRGGSPRGSRRSSSCRRRWARGTRRSRRGGPRDRCPAPPRARRRRLRSPRIEMTASPAAGGAPARLRPALVVRGSSSMRCNGRRSPPRLSSAHGLNSVLHPGVEVSPARCAAHGTRKWNVPTSTPSIGGTTPGSFSGW